MPAANPLIAHEGWPYLAATGIGAILVQQYFGLIASLPLWAGMVLLLFLFRDPEREIPSTPSGILSPVDGRVMFVERRSDSYLNSESVHIGIRMSALGGYSVRSPVEGKALQARQHGNSIADKPSATPGNKPFGVRLQTDEGDPVVLLMNRAPLGIAPRCYVQFGDRVGQGQRCGFVHLGTLVEVIVPTNARVRVGVGDQVRSGADVIATLVHK